LRGNRNAPRLLWLRPANRLLSQALHPLSDHFGNAYCMRASARYTPWQIIVSTLTALYAARHLDHILGLGGERILLHITHVPI
jgi:hypothetical protein